MKLLEVEWEDIVCGYSWEKLEDLPKPQKCRSIGWLVVDDPTYIVIAATIGQHEGPKEGPEYNQSMTIPRGCITRTTDIHG